MKKTIHDILTKNYPEYSDLCTDDDRDDFWSNLNNTEKYKVNSEYLRLTENPEYDYLVCYEPGRMDTDEKVTDYDTMYDVDYKWWKFQRDTQWESIEESKKMMEQGDKHSSPERIASMINSFNERYDTYQIYMSGDWFRLIENDVFIYAQFISAKWYLFYIAEDFLLNLQEENIPYTFVETDDPLGSFDEDDPKKIYDAAGREHELKKFKDEIRKYQSHDLLTHIDYLIAKYKRVFSGKTFRFDSGYEPGEKFDPFTDFIFYDEQSLTNVSPKKFLKTFKENQGNFSDFEIMIGELKDQLTEDFYRLYNKNKARFNKNQ